MDVRVCSNVCAHPQITEELSRILREEKEREALEMALSGLDSSQSMNQVGSEALEQFSSLLRSLQRKAHIVRCADPRFLLLLLSVCLSLL